MWLTIVFLMAILNSLNDHYCRDLLIVVAILYVISLLF